MNMKTKYITGQDLIRNSFVAKHKRNKKLRAVTLLELLIALSVGIVAIGGYIESTSYGLFLSRTSQQSSVALSDLRNMMERIGMTPFQRISLEFPDGVINGMEANQYEDIVGGYSLREENISVNYPDLSGNPLEIIVTVSWVGPKSRAQSLSLSTMRTE